MRIEEEKEEEEGDEEENKINMRFNCSTPSMMLMKIYVTMHLMLTPKYQMEFRSNCLI